MKSRTHNIEVALMRLWGTFFFFLNLWAPLRTNAVEVIHLPQTHHLDNVDYSKPEAYARIARSQHSIAKFLIKSNARYVMSEHIATWQALPLDDAPSVFFNGFPDDYDLLLPEEKIYLSKNGAARVLLSLGYLEEVWGATTATDQKYANKLRNETLEAWTQPKLTNAEKLFQLTRKSEDYNFAGREKLALNLLNRHIEETRDSARIYVIYGSEHDFLRHQDEFPKLKLRRAHLAGATSPASYFGPVPEWGYTNMLSPDEQILFYSLIIKEHPELSAQDRAYAALQQREIISMLERSKLKLSPQSYQSLLPLLP